MTGHDADDVRQIVTLQHQVLQALLAVPDASAVQAATALALILVQVWAQADLDIEDLHEFLDETAETARDYAPPVAEC
jgi:hypothetical protein